MSRLQVALGAATCFVAGGVAHARPISLPEALAMADQSPSLAVAAADVDEARGNLEQASKFRYNPTLSITSGPRFGPVIPLAADVEIGISQVFELGGKRGARKRVAEAERGAASEKLEAQRLTVRAEVRRAFQLALVAQARIQVAVENETWSQGFVEAARERMKLGAATQTELNVAASGLGRAIAAHRDAERDALAARQALGAALGVTGHDLEPTGSLPTFPASPPDENALVAAALKARRDLAASERARSARLADVELADAEAVPDAQLSATWMRSPFDPSNAFIFGLSFDLPLWNRNQGARSAARAAGRRAGVEVSALRTSVERDVRIAVRTYAAATAAVAAFDQQVVGSLTENLKLARETLAAGKLGLLDINNVRRDLVESQLTYLAAIAAAVESRASLERALGRALEETP